MITIQRLTEDSSWFLQWNQMSLIIDPWLIGSEIDGFKWLNEQWHTTDPIKIADLPDYDAILISQSYEDHCHTPTLEKLNTEKDILATPKAYKKLKKRFSNRKITPIPNDNSFLFNQFGVRCFIPDKILDPIYYAVLITNKENEGIFYSPHGFSLSDKDVLELERIRVKLLITTFTEFDLPSLLGGKVNPGLNNVEQLSQQISPEVVLNTHDEDKIMKGLVSKKARVKYADYESLLQTYRFNFKHIKGYEPVNFS